MHTHSIHTHTHTHTCTDTHHTVLRNAEKTQLHKLFKKTHTSYEYILALKGVLIFY